MRVAILAPGLGYDAGAIPIRARLAGNLMVTRGHDVRGFGIQLSGFQPIRAEFPITSFPVTKLPSPLASLSVWLAYEFTLARRLVALDRNIGGLDLIISHWQTYGLTQFIAKRETGARWVSLVHRTIYDIIKSGNGGRNFLFQRIVINGCRREFGGADAVIALHEGMAREIREHVPQAERIEVFPNGVDLVESDNLKEAAEKDPSLVLYVGRLDLEKRVHDLLRAFCCLNHPGAWLAVVGDGELRPTLEELALKLGCADRVKFLGKLSHEETLRWMRRASIFVLVSSSEGMPFVVLEAMAARCAIVCSDIEGNRAILAKRHAHFVPVGDLNAIKGALCALLSDANLRRQNADHAFEEAKRFSWNQIIKNEVEFYEKLVSKRKQHG